MDITVAGTGYVGLVAGVCFAEVGYNVTCVDTNAAKIEKLSAGICPIYEEGLETLIQKNLAADRLHFTTDYGQAYHSPDVIFIGVGTPEREDGSADLSHLATASRQIAKSLTRDCLVVVKSTVPVGTNDKVEQFIKDSLVHDVKVEVASNPEFLSQGTAVHDTIHAARIIIGTNSAKAEAKLRALYAPFNLPVVSVDRRSAEMIKYASNVFLALKLSYMNDIANLCELVGADIRAVEEGMSYDERIGARFLGAGVGYGGSCFPKDTKALCWLATQNHYDLKTVHAAVEVNNRQKAILFRKAEERVISFAGLRVAVLGVTFKPGTDDLREAPALDNLQLLLAAGADVTVYDPIGTPNLAQLYPEGQHGRGSIHYAAQACHALEEADIAFIFTEWSQIKKINPLEYCTRMRTPLLYDGRNLYDVRKMQAAGVEYYSIGRRKGVPNG